MTIRQYVISDPAIIIYKQSHYETTGTPSVVWQQQMEKAYIKTYKLVQNDRPDQYYERDYTADFGTQFRTLPLIEGYNPHCIDPEYGTDPYWDNFLYDQETLQFKGEEHPPIDDEDDPEIPDNQLSRTLIKIWQPNPQINNIVELGYEPIKDEVQATRGLLDETAFLHVLVTKEEEPTCVPLSTSLELKYKKRMLYIPMDFGELTIVGLIDTRALSSGILEADFWKIRLLVPQSIIKEGPAPSFRIMVAKGQLETPKEHRRTQVRSRRH